MKRLRAFFLTAVFMLTGAVSPVGFIGEKKAYAKNSVSDTVSILEIVPDYKDKSELSHLDGTNFDDNKKISVISMTMNSFISMRDDVSGLYDIVYFAKGNYGLVAGCYDQQDPSASGEDYSPRRYNDITNLRAETIAQMIEEGRCVIINKSAFQDTTSKMYSNFSKYLHNPESYKGLKIWDNKCTIDINGLKEAYNLSTKRPAISNVEPPADSYENGNKFSISFLASTFNKAPGYTANFYIDINRDSLFKEDEKKVVKQHLKFGEQTTIAYDLPLMYTANLYYKLEVVEEDQSGLPTGVKNTLTGMFKYKGKPISVSVLQISPGNDNRLNLAYELRNKYVDGHPIGQNEDFSISVENVKSYDFQNAFNNKKSIEYKKYSNLGENYDMLIFGFADSYANGDITNSDAMNAIRDYYATGQGLMLTHDTIWYVQDDNSKFPVNLSRNFVKDAGQTFDNESLYKTLINRKVQNRPLKYLYDIYKCKDDQYMRYTYYRPLDGIAYSKQKYTGSTSIKNINSGVITDYPYQLPAGGFRVAKTHDMYYTLNLEDPDVIPWYNLDVSGYDKDSTNSVYYYYTYSTKNITFSGTGHSPDEIGDADNINELKLFVNTMVKGYLAANHKPEIDVELPVANQEISSSDDTIAVTFTPYDYDLGDADNITLKVSAEGVGEIASFSDLKSGVRYSKSIPNPFRGTGNNTGTIVFEAMDSSNATCAVEVPIKISKATVLPRPVLSYEKFQNTHNPVIGGYVFSNKKDSYKVMGRILDENGKHVGKKAEGRTDSEGMFSITFNDIPDTEDFSKPYTVKVKQLPNEKYEKESEETEWELYIDTINPEISDMKINGIPVTEQGIMALQVGNVNITCNVEDNDPQLASVNKNMFLQAYDEEKNEYKEPIKYQTVKNGLNEFNVVSSLQSGRYRFTIEAEDRAGNSTTESFEFTISTDYVSEVSLDFGGDINHQKKINNEDVLAVDGSSISIKLTVKASPYADVTNLVIPVVFSSDSAESGFYSVSDGVYIKNIAPEGQSPNPDKVYVTSDPMNANKTDIVISETLPKGTSRTYTFFVKGKTSSKVFKEISLSINTLKATSGSEVHYQTLKAEEKLNMLVIKSTLR